MITIIVTVVLHLVVSNVMVKKCKMTKNETNIIFPFAIVYHCINTFYMYQLFNILKIGILFALFNFKTIHFSNMKYYNHAQVTDTLYQTR